MKNGSHNAAAGKRKEESEGGRNRNKDPVDAARMVGELVTAIDNLRVGKAEPEADFLEAISRQMLGVAKFVEQSVDEAGADRPTG